MYVQCMLAVTCGREPHLLWIQRCSGEIHGVTHSYKVIVWCALNPHLTGSCLEMKPIDVSHRYLEITCSSWYYLFTMAASYVSYTCILIH